MLNEQSTSGSKLLPKKKSYKRHELGRNVQLEPDLIVRLAMYSNEYHYQCLLCNYHKRINDKFNKDHKHEKYKMKTSSSNQTKLTDFTKHLNFSENQDLNQKAELYISLLSVLACISPYSLGKSRAKQTLDNLIELGFEYKLKNPDAQSFPSNFLKYTPKKISQSISNLDQIISTKILKQFKGKMINIFVDAGTVNSIHSIEILISSNDITPFPFTSISTNGYVTSEIYYKELLKVFLNIIRELEAIPISIIGDNLAAQRRSVNDLLPTSIQATVQIDDSISLHEKQIIKGISYVSCLNHVLNLALQDALTQIDLLQDSVSVLESFQLFLKDSDIRSFLAKTLKVSLHFSMCKHRWVYVYDAACYILKNRQTILNIFSSDKKAVRDVLAKFGKLTPDSFTRISHLILLLEPIKILSEKIESNNCLLSEFKFRFAETLHELRSRSAQNELQNPVNEMIDIFYNRLFYKARYDLIEASFLLSPLGKLYYNYITSGNADFYLEKYCLTDDSIEIYEFLNNLPTILESIGISQKFIKYTFLRFPHSAILLSESSFQENQINNTNNIHGNLTPNNQEDNDEDNEEMNEEMNEEKLKNEKQGNIDFLREQFSNIFSTCLEEYTLFNSFTIETFKTLSQTRKSQFCDLFKQLKASMARFYNSIITICKSSLFLPFFSNFEFLFFDQIIVSEDETIDDFFNAMSLSHDIIELLNNILKNNNFTIVYSSDCMNIADDLISDYENSRVILDSSISKFELLSDSNHDEYDMSLNANTPYVLTLTLIIQKATFLGFTEEECIMLTKEFNNWIQSNNFLIDKYSFYDLDLFWKIKGNSGNFQILHKIAPYFSLLCCSEAAVERIFSKRKNFLNPHYTNIHNETLFSKVQLETGIEILNSMNDLTIINEQG